MLCKKIIFSCLSIMLVTGLSSSITFSSDALPILKNVDKILLFNFSEDVRMTLQEGSTVDLNKPTKLILRTRAGSLDILLFFGDQGINLAAIDPINEDWLIESVEAAMHDFNNDGIEEIIVARAGGGFLKATVFQYSPEKIVPGQSLDFSQFNVVGEIIGMFELRVYEDLVIAPLGSQGMYNSYRWSESESQLILEE